MASSLLNTGAGYTPNLVDSIRALGDAIGFLFQGDMAGFSQSIVAVIPAVGVFLILYGLMLFVAKITIFRDTEHKKYAQFFAIGVALIGLFTPPVFGFISGVLGGSMLIILLVIFVIFAIIIFTNRMRKSHLETRTDVAKAQTENFGARKDLAHESRDLHAETQLAGMERKDISNAEREMDSFSKLAQTTKQKVHALRNIIGQVGHMQGGPTQEIRDRIMSQSAALVDDLRVEYKDLEKVDSKLHELQNLEFKEIQLQKDEAQTLAHLKAELNKQFEAEGTHKDKREESIKQHEKQLENLVNQAHQLEVQKMKTITQLEQLSQQELQQVKQIGTMLHNDLRNALVAGNYEEALNILDEVDQHLTKVEQSSQTSRSTLKELENFERSYAHMENEIQDHMHYMVKGEKRVSKKIKREIHEESAINREVQGILKELDRLRPAQLAAEHGGKNDPRYIHLCKDLARIYKEHKGADITAPGLKAKMIPYMNEVGEHITT